MIGFKNLSKISPWLRGADLICEVLATAFMVGIVILLLLFLSDMFVMW